jgi:DNA-directed RNA polymerase specialized sigma subunit
MRHYWDDDEECWIPLEQGSPSAEDEYFASLEPPEPDYTPEVILALSGLSEKQRFAVECRYGFRTHGRSMSVREIASYMGIDHSNVVRLLQRAEESMRDSTKKRL